MNLIARSKMRNVIFDIISQDAVNKGKKTSVILTTRLLKNRGALYPSIVIMVKGKR